MKNCEKCDGKLKMYYREYCPRCEKPTMTTLVYLNLLECLYHLEAHGHKGIKQRIWEYFMDEISNESFFTMSLPPEIEPSDKLYEDLKLIKETWNIEGNEITMFVSW